MRRTPVVVWKDFLDASRSLLLWAAVAVMTGIVLMLYLVAWWTGSDPTPMDIIAPAAILLQLLVPLLGLIIGYRSVVSERQSGSIKLLLSLPPSRGAVVAGKFIGRSLVLMTAILAAFGVFIFLSVVLFQELPLADFVGLAVAAGIVGVAFVGIAVGVSSLVNSRGQAMAGVISVYLMFLLFWDLFTAGIHRLVMGELPDGPGGTFEAWYLFFQWLNPLEAYTVLTNAFLDESFVAFTLPFFAPFDASDVEGSLAGEAPWYLSEPVAVVVLIAWAAIPVAVGWLRFERVDLG